MYESDYSDTESSIGDSMLCACGNDDAMCNSDQCEYCNWSTAYNDGTLEEYSIYNPFWSDHFRSAGRVLEPRIRLKDGTPIELMQQVQESLDHNPFSEYVGPDIKELLYLRGGDEPEPEPEIVRAPVTNWTGLFTNSSEGAKPAIEDKGPTVECATQSLYDLLGLRRDTPKIIVTRTYRKKALGLMADKKKAKNDDDKDSIQGRYDTLMTAFEEFKR